jgi:hypothetical protein
MLEINTFFKHYKDNVISVYVFVTFGTTVESFAAAT